MALSDIIPWRGRTRELARRDDPLTYFHRQIDRIFNDAFGAGSWPAEGGVSFAPDVDITETDKEVKVCAELPGIEAKDLNIDVTNDALTISGEKRSEHTEEEEGRHWTERSYGAFRRTIPLPAEVNGAQAKAECKGGVLRVTMPKREGGNRNSHNIKIT